MTTTDDGSTTRPVDALIPIELTVNGEPHRVEVTGSTTLLDAVRWGTGFTGSKECCAAGECGACSILVDGRLVNSCLVLAAEVDGSAVTTAEGLEQDGRLSRLQEAFLSEGAVQCGFCIPGMVMAAHALLEAVPRPSDEQIKEGLAGNLCRCAGYEQILEAVRVAATGDDDE
jgi:carbon-monoxide dehydrogenase small subunit